MQPAVLFSLQSFVPHLHTEKTYGRSGCPLHNLVSDSAHPHYV